MTRIGVLVNDAGDIAPAQTTAMLLGELVARRLDVRVFGVADLGVTRTGEVTARARRVPAIVPATPALRPPDALAPLVHAIRDAPAEPASLADLDALLIRTNPARDDRAWAHAAALELARAVRDGGAVVLNDPDGLALAASKLFLARLPAWMRPPTVATADRDELIAFVRHADCDCVLKPAVGTRGNDVFRVSPDDPNLSQIAGVLLRAGYAIAQAFVPEAAAGDTRVLVMDGALLTVAGEVAAVRRVPGSGEFRSNLHAGGVAHPAEITDGMRAVVDCIGPRLAARGLFLCGLDFIGDRLCEVNVFSTGGLRDAERFTQCAFTARVVDSVLARAHARTTHTAAAPADDSE